MQVDKTSSDYSRELEAQIQGKVCHCGESLHVAWFNREYVTRCKNNHINGATQRVKSALELWKMGIPIDPYLEQTYARQEAQGKIKRKVNKGELPF